MTALTVVCPHCDQKERIHFEAEDTFIALGEQIGPGQYEMKAETEISVFHAAQVAYTALEKANETISAMAAEFDQLSSESGTRSTDVHSHGPFVASTHRRMFHRPECKWAQAFLNGRSCEIFERHEDAVAAGKKPCRTCCA